MLTKKYRKIALLCYFFIAKNAVCVYNYVVEKVKNKQKVKNQDISKFKRDYFDFYDDIKDYTNGKEDW